MDHPPLGHGQDVTTMLGSVLRIDVEQEPYGIPLDNPLVDKELPDDVEYQGNEPRQEIWAWGIKEGTHWFDPDDRQRMIEEGA
jgi:hypothetical protein